MSARIAYKVLGYDAKNLRVQLSFDGGASFMFAQLRDPLPSTVEAFEQWVLSFVPDYSTIVAREADHSATDAVIEKLTGVDRVIDLAAPTAPADVDTASLDDAEQDYIKGIVHAVLIEKGLINA